MIAQSNQSFRVLETSHPPTWYISPADVNFEYLEKTEKRSFCEWKGAATYYSLVHAGKRLENVAWQYEHPTAPFEAIRDHVAFYPNFLDCYVDEEKVAAQPGSFYGGWITSEIVGPFKGAAGTQGW